MINDDSYTEYESNVDSYRKVNVGEDVNVSDVVPFSGEFLMISAVYLGCKLIQEFERLDTNSQLNCTFAPRSTYGTI